MTPRVTGWILLALLALPATSRAFPAAPGDTASAVVLVADFSGDTVGLSPDTSLPGGPSGDFLTLNTTAGTIQVVSSVDGLTSKPVEMKQQNRPGGVELRAWTADGPPGVERATVRWRSLARDANPVFLMRCAVRSGSGDVIASVDYRPSRALTYNLGSTLPVSYSNNQAQQFTIEVDFLGQTTSLSIDGAPVAGFQSVPFLAAASAVGGISFSGDESHPQTLVMDDISVVVFARDPDRVPELAAPVATDGEELGTITFEVTASDPDGDSISSLTMDGSVLPAGADASFTPADASNTSATFLWHPERGEAGQYDLVFTATADGSSATATTRLHVAVFGTSITGTLIWTPEAGDEGSHFVTFTATDSRNDTTTAVTEIVVSAPAATYRDPAPLAGGAPLLRLAPGAIQKGPVVSSPTRTSATVGTTVTVTATATDTTGLLGGVEAAAPLSLGSLAPSAPWAATALTLAADLSEVPGATFVVDQSPIVTAPASVSGDAGVKVLFTIFASDPDGDALLDLDADLSGLPASNDATFLPNPFWTSGVFQWTPGVADSGSYEISFLSTNNLAGSARTRIDVRGTPSARVFLPGKKRIRLSSNKATECLYLEAAGSSFDLREVDPTTVRLGSRGTGAVSEIPMVAGKTIVLGDKDGNMTPDMQICFTKSDLRLLFSGLRGNVSVPVTVRGTLVTGGTFHGEASLPISAGNGGFLASVSPNPLNPLGTLTFSTRRAERVTVKVYDLSGRLVRTLWDGAMPEGDHALPVDGRDGSRNPVASGVYFYRIESAGQMETGRFTIMK